MPSRTPRLSAAADRVAPSWRALIAGEIHQPARTASRALSQRFPG